MKPALHAIIGVLLVAFSASLPLGCDSEKADSKRSEKERKKAADDDEDDAPAKKDKKSAAAKSSDAPPVASPPGSEAPPKATVPTITGSYNVSGTNPNGSAYRGTLEVKDREKVLRRMEELKMRPAKVKREAVLAGQPEALLALRTSLEDAWFEPPPGKGR